MTKLDSFGTQTLNIGPLTGFPIERDLIVDMSTFYKQYERAEPWLQADEPPPADERRQSPEERAKLDGLYECILCACCTTSCPSFWANEQYVGPAAIVSAHRFIFDSRDRAAAERLKILNDQFGVYPCHTIFNCTVACPREIEITQAIGEVKKAIVTGRLD